MISVQNLALLALASLLGTALDPVGGAPDGGQAKFSLGDREARGVAGRGRSGGRPGARQRCHE